MDPVPQEELLDESLVDRRPTGLSKDKLICSKNKPVGDLHTLFTHFPIRESLTYWLDYADIVTLTQVNDQFRILFLPALKAKRLMGLENLSRWISKQLIMWEVYTVKQLNNLKTLNSRCSFDTFPPEIGFLTNLKWLDFSSSHIKTIQPKIGQLSNLKWLHLDWNQITEIPPEIGQLTSLRGLFLKSNNIIEIPPVLGQLINLTELNLSYNKIMVLPKTLGQLINLKVLNLARNNITEIPSEIGNLTKLKLLHLEGNQISTIPSQIGQLTNLKEIYLKHNVFLKLDRTLVAKLEQQGTKLSWPKLNPYLK